MKLQWSTQPGEKGGSQGPSPHLAWTKELLDKKETRRQNKSVHLQKINMRRKGQSVEPSKNMLAAPLGSDPCQHWEHTTVYTQHAISAPKPPLETASPEAASHFTPAHKEHKDPQAFPASGNTFTCHWLPPRGHHHLRSTYEAEKVFCCRGGEERRTMRNSDGDKIAFKKRLIIK